MRYEAAVAVLTTAVDRAQATQVTLSPHAAWELLV